MTLKSAPIFEQSTSTLHYSNDQRLHVFAHVHSDDLNIALPRTVYSVVRLGEDALDDGDLDNAEVVFTTFDRVKADAYIAGYDLATA